MKVLHVLLLFTCAFSFKLIAQNQITVVKTNGDTIYCDKITAGGKNIICETTGAKKNKLKSSEVSFYIEPYQLMIHDGDPPLMRDTTRKCFVPADGKIHEVLMENSSYYLTGAMSTPLLGRNSYEEYYITNKKNVIQAKLDVNKTIPDLLLQYFGGTCPEFDAKLKEVKPKFNNKIFPWEEFAGLIALYNKSCKT